MGGGVVFLLCESVKYFVLGFLFWIVIFCMVCYLLVVVMGFFLGYKVKDNELIFRYGERERVSRVESRVGKYW